VSDVYKTCSVPGCPFASAHLHVHEGFKVDPKLLASGREFVSREVLPSGHMVETYSVPKTRLHFALVVLGYSLAMVALGALFVVLGGAVLRWFGVT